MTTSGNGNQIEWANDLTIVCPFFALARETEVRMELKELTERSFELFGIHEPDQLGEALMEACNDQDRLRAFREMVGGELGVDWLQKIYQYNLADRKEKKQDFTPPSLARFMGMLAGQSSHVVDMCAGSGALIIQKWKEDPGVSFTAVEADEGVIPFLLFNLALRNIRCIVYQADALAGEDYVGAWAVEKGEEFGHITRIESSV